MSVVNWEKKCQRNISEYLSQKWLGYRFQGVVIWYAFSAGQKFYSSPAPKHPWGPPNFQHIWRARDSSHRGKTTGHHTPPSVTDVNKVSSRCFKSVGLKWITVVNLPHSISWRFQINLTVTFRIMTLSFCISQKARFGVKTLLQSQDF
jgi:hypothetical protein